MDKDKGWFPRGNETLRTSTQGSGELLLMVPRFTPQKKWQLKGPAPRVLEPVLRVDELSFWMTRKAIPFISHPLVSLL